jgi:hypothetical protein
MKRIILGKDKVKKELQAALKAFPNQRFADPYYMTGGKAHLIARILFLSGAKTVNHCVMWLGGRQEIGCVMPHTFSIIITPYLKAPDSSEHNLFYWLLKKAGVPYSGMASDSGLGYMQACPSKKYEELMRDIIIYFNSYNNAFCRYGSN